MKPTSICQQGDSCAVSKKWASAWAFQQCGMCDQQSLRSACTYVQSDQSLCLSLEYSMSVKVPNEHLLEVLSLKGGCTCSLESTLFKMSHCWKSHATAQMACTVIKQFTEFKTHILGHEIIPFSPGRQILLKIRKFSQGLYFRDTCQMPSFMKIKPSWNGEITLSFADIGKSYTSHDFLMSQICP